MIRENWHERIISEIASKLQFLKNDVNFSISKKSTRGPDIEIETKNTKRKINIEVQQFDSGSRWKNKTIPSWEKRHDLFTLVVFPEPALERVLSKTDKIKEYRFFSEQGIFLFSDAQISEICSFLGSLIINQNL